MSSMTLRNCGVLAALLVGVQVTGGCRNGGKGSQKDLGSLSLAVKVAEGVVIDKVDYEVTGNAIDPITGSIVVKSTEAKASVLINGIPPGILYGVTMTAVSIDDVFRCSGSAQFDIEARRTTAVTIVLVCLSDKNTGAVEVNGVFKICPSLTSYTVAPLAVGVGSAIDVSAKAINRNPGATAPMTFAWTATAGSFVDPAAGTTKYNCAAAGPHVLTIKVSDGSCGDSASINVNCVSTTCGNGTLEADKGEECDPPNGTTCDTTCMGIPVVCGNGILQPTEQCEPPGTATCDVTCQTIGGGGGDTRDGGSTVVDAAVEDVAAGGGGSGGGGTGGGGAGGSGGTGGGGNGGTGGGGAGGSGGTGGGGTGGGGTGGGGSGGGGSACQTCEGQKCDPTYQGCGSDMTPADKAACEAVLTCIRANAACVMGADLQKCYCGTASDAACLGTGANGPCKTQIEAAAKATDATSDGTAAGEDAALRYYDPLYPVGRATNLLLCDVEFCSAQCGVD